MVNTTGKISQETQEAQETKEMAEMKKMYGIGGKGGIDVYDVACVGILVADAIAKTVDKLPERGKTPIGGPTGLVYGRVRRECGNCHGKDRP